MKEQRWPAEIITYRDKKRDGAPEFNAKIDFDPKTGKPWGVFIWRSDKTTQDVDEDLDELSRKISRVMQRRYP
jgi:hypothetical protein